MNFGGDLQNNAGQTKEDREKIKKLFNDYDLIKMRQFNRINDFNQKVYPKTLIRQIMSSMRNEDGYTSYIFMAFMNKEITEKIKADQNMKSIDESYREKDRVKLIPRVFEVDILRMMQWFMYTEFDFKTTSHIRDENGKIVQRFQKEIWVNKSEYYKVENEDKFRTSSRYYSSQYSDEYIRLVNYRKSREERKKLKKDQKAEFYNNDEPAFEDELEKQERLEDLDQSYSNKTEKYQLRKQTAEMEFQESLFGLYQILFGSPNQYTPSQRKKHFVMIMTYLLFDANDKQLNEKLCPFYCIFPDHLEYQIIVRKITGRYNCYSYREYKTEPVMSLYNKIIYRLEKFILKYPKFDKVHNFQQNYVLLLFRTRAYDKCINFIVEKGMTKLPSSLVGYYDNTRESENNCFTIKEFWYPLFSRMNCDQLSNISHQIMRSTYDREDYASLRFFNTLYSLVQDKPQAAEVLIKIGDVYKYLPNQTGKEDFIRFNHKASGIYPQCNQAWNNLAKHYLETQKPNEFLEIMESYCMMNDKGQQLVEGIEKFISQVNCKWLSKALVLYRQSSYQTLSKNFAKLMLNLDAKFHNQQFSIRAKYLNKLISLEEENTQQVLFCFLFKRDISQYLIFQQEYSHYDLFY